MAKTCGRIKFLEAIYKETDETILKVFKHYCDGSVEELKNQVSVFGIFRKAFLTFHLGCFEITLTLYLDDHPSYLRSSIGHDKFRLKKYETEQLQCYSEDNEKAIETIKMYIRGAENTLKILENAIHLPEGEIRMKYTKGKLEINGEVIKAKDTPICYKTNKYYIRVDIEKF
jgi:hypothetical protein